MTPDLFFSMLDFDWVGSQLTGGNPVPFLIWTAFVATLSFLCGRWWRGRRLDALVVRELGRRQGFERVNSVALLIDKADALADEVSASTEALAEKDGEIARAKAEAERRLAMKENELRDRLERAEEELKKKLAERDAGAVAERSEDEIASERYRRIVAGFSRTKAEAALRAYDADGMIEARERERLEIIGSIQARQGVFTMQALEYHGMTIQTDTYGITDGFRAWLASDDGNRALLARPS